MVQCRICHARHIPNTIFCTECGTYLPERKDLSTEPMDTAQTTSRKTRIAPFRPMAWPAARRPLVVRLVIGQGTRQRELLLSMGTPIRLGRADPIQNISPEVDLTDDLAVEYGVSREHACIYGRGKRIVVEDLGSTNGTLLNGRRLEPYLPEILRHGDQLQLGKLPIEVRLA